MDKTNNYENVCYNQSLTVGDYVKEWANNKTSDTIIHVAPYFYVPFAFYTIFNDSHYQWCGPMLLLAKYFAKFSNTKYSSLLKSIFYKCIVYLKFFYVVEFT